MDEHDQDRKIVRKKRIEQGGFLLFLALITLFLALIAAPFASALLWAILAAIMFQPLFRWMLGRAGADKPNTAALATLLVITVAIIIPSFIIGSMIVDQATDIYLALKDQQIDAGAYFDQVHGALPIRLQTLIDNSGYGEFETLRDRLSDLVRDSLGMIASKALAIGGSLASFVLSLGVGLYVTYFLLRDGQHIGPAIRDCLPLSEQVATRLTSNFVSVIRATIKGSIVVALVQGALGAITFWIAGVPATLLFGLLMAIFALLPALGPAIVWVPVAVYLLAIGNIWQGLAVIGSGILVIGMADNVLRPILVGRDTGIPDWVILVTTLGGIAMFGISGIVLGPVAAGLFIVGWTTLRDQRRDAVHLNA